MGNTQNIKVAVDAVVFKRSNDDVSLLLIKRKNDPFENQWALPGGFVNNDESLGSAVERELKEETGLNINGLQQLYTFGKPDRDPRSRIISVAYFGLIQSEQINTLKANTDAKEAKWFDVKDLPELAFDHENIIDMALERLKKLFP